MEGIPDAFELTACTCKWLVMLKIVKRILPGNGIERFMVASLGKIGPTVVHTGGENKKFADGDRFASAFSF